jgi:RING finger protein 113A
MADNVASTSAEPSLFKKKSRAPRSLRKRSVSPGGAAEGASAEASSSTAATSESTVVQRKARRTHNPLGASTGRKRAKLDLSSDESDDGAADVAPAHHLDRLKPSAGRGSDLAGHSWASGNGFADPADAARGQIAFGIEQAPAGEKESNADGVYRGAAAYDSYVAKRDDGRAGAQKATGPIRQTANVRTITVTDYQPDVCKDYKETGYCGFGDTCKFLHDRSDYLAGWQLDQLPNSAARHAGDAESEEEEEVPFACLLCRQDFTDPVVTKCGHYFCAACAIKRYAKTPKCFACGAQTQGIFNAATKVLQRMEKRKQEREQARRDGRKGWGDESGDEEEDRGGEILEGVEIGGDGAESE